MSDEHDNDTGATVMQNGEWVALAGTIGDLRKLLAEREDLRNGLRTAIARQLMATTVQVAQQLACMPDKDDFRSLAQGLKDAVSAIVLQLAPDEQKEITRMWLNQEITPEEADALAEAQRTGRMN